ncbi:hypothetical protein ACFLZZ_02655 [Nanoarchaeota archaeon]
MRKETCILFVFLMFIVSLTSVSAVGVSTPHWNTNPLVMTPGEVKEVYFTISNKAGATEDIVMRASLTAGEEIASLTDSNLDYKVKAGTTEGVNVLITIPEDALPEDKYSLGFSFTTVKIGEGGGVSLGLAFDHAFEVIIESPEPVAEEESEKPAFDTNSLVVLLAVVVVLALLWWFLLRKKR